MPNPLTPLAFQLDLNRRTFLGRAAYGLGGIALACLEPQMADQARPLYREANELLLIFASMYRK